MQSLYKLNRISVLAHLMPQNCCFSKFYKNKGKQAANMKTYTLEQIEELGLDLQNGMQDLPQEMVNRLTKNGIKDLFPVQSSTYSLFVQEQNELIVKSRTGTGKTLSFLFE